MDKRCKNTACGHNRGGRCRIIPNSRFFRCKQCGDELVDL